jgi:hypothetical protein
MVFELHCYHCIICMELSYNGILPAQGYYRRGAAYLAMGKFKDALKDFRQVL